MVLRWIGNKDPNKFRSTRNVLYHLFQNKVRIILISCISVSPLLIALNLVNCNNKLSQQNDFQPKFAPQNERIGGGPQTLFITDEINDNDLRHVIAVLERIGFEKRVIEEEASWDVLWAYGHPFSESFRHLVSDLLPHQKVNHFPGIHEITNKVLLATTVSKFIPVAFQLPKDSEKLLVYARENPASLFVEKNNKHRGIRIKDVSDINMDSKDTFVQKYVENPLLIGGHKFDVGVYVIVTSVDPLRAYVFNDEVVLRFCTDKYHPFDPKVAGKYVVSDKYLSIWDIKPLKPYFADEGLSSKHSLSSYLQSVGKDPAKMWSAMEKAIREILQKSEATIAKEASKYKSKRNFFEMFRFDFFVDEDLNVFLMEANMSPNLSSAHTSSSKQRFEQLLFNVFSLVGIGRKVHSDSLASSSADEHEMQVTSKNLAVFPLTCNSLSCRNNCDALECRLCRRCLTPLHREMLVDAFLEHENRLGCRRIVPPAMTHQDANKTLHFENLNVNNQLMHRWFQGKCLLDAAWCI